MSASPQGENPFDLDEWLDSVKGRTVKVTAPKEGSLGFMPNKLMSSRVPSEDEDTYCGNCEDYVRLIDSHDEEMGHCPMCGKIPGMLELGTKRGEDNGGLNHA